MKIHNWIIVFMIAIGCSLGSASYVNKKVDKHQLQLDQASSVVFSLAREQGAREQMGFFTNNEYCLFYADFNNGRALLGEFDGEISFDKKPRLIIMSNVKDEMLQNWNAQPIIYGRYRKIR